MSEKLRHQRLAQAIDVHHLARGKVQQALAQASRTIDVDAAVIDFAFGRARPRFRRPGTGGEDGNRRAARMVFVCDHFNDLGNDIAAALDQHEVADLHPEARDLVGVVQGGAGDSGAADEDRAQHGDRRQLAGPADLDGNLFDFRDARAARQICRRWPSGAPCR